MRNARWFSSILIAFQLATLVVSPAFAEDGGQATVKLQIQTATNVRSQHDDQRNVLVQEYTLPAGSVIEVPKKELEKPILMKFWDALTGQEQSKAPFVKNIRLISAPGYTKSDIREFNAMNEDYDLFMSRNKLADSDMISQDDVRESVRMHHATAVHRDQNMGPYTGKLSGADARNVLDKINQANRSVEAAGRGQENCEACDSGFAQRWIRAGVPARALKKALTYYNANRNKIRNPRYITINDFTESSGNKRMFILDMRTGAVEKHLVAHGVPKRLRGRVDFPGFSSQASSKMTPRGFFLASEKRGGKHGLSMSLDGLEAQNRNSRARGIIFHSAPYVSNSMARNYGRIGRSNGCLAVDPSESRGIIEKIHGGSLVLNYGGE